ncbi:YbaB/EbfC family nucleoid-associated protein [Nonomuraea sp. B12E4]|uniref:YbaB/EbfC family nucleoid-associated protein n=1 Tax=Nonomuraea sp. B12E4 TaxID=3153564 RepID=UPI00325CD638
MQEFGDFAKIDIDKLLKGADRQLALLGEFQQNVGSLVGRAQDEDGFVTVEYGQEGVRELELHPKAMRLSSGELAELIKTALKDATDDFQKQLHEAAGELFGEEDNPMKFDPEAMTERLHAAQRMHDRAFEDVMGELDGIRRRLGL